jgi:hypothetical protein
MNLRKPQAFGSTCLRNWYAKASRCQQTSTLLLVTASWPNGNAVEPESRGSSSRNRPSFGQERSLFQHGLGGLLLFVWRVTVPAHGSWCQNRVKHETGNPQLFSAFKSYILSGFCTGNRLQKNRE